jgi:hypothetical protein
MFLLPWIVVGGTTARTTEIAAGHETVALMVVVHQMRLTLVIRRRDVTSILIRRRTPAVATPSTSAGGLFVKATQVASGKIASRH